MIKKSHRFLNLRRLGFGLLLGAFCAVVVAGVRQVGWLSVVERNLLDALFQARGSGYPSPHIAIVVADDASVARAGGWPLPRRSYGDVIHRLHRAGVRTIAFDVLFSKPSYSPRDDEALAKACGEAGSVISAAVFQLPSDNRKTTLIDLPGDIVAPLPRFGIDRRRVPCLKAVGGIGPRPALQQSSVAVGHINVRPDRDGTLRHISHLIRFREVTYPSLALASATHFLGLKAQDVVVDEGTIILPGQHQQYRVPIDGEAQVLVNWIGGTRSFPTYSFEQLLSGDVPEESLKDKIVLIGVTATAAFDHYPSPFSPAQPAVEVQANAINDILSQRILRPVSLPLQWVLLFLTAMLAGAFMARRSAWNSVLLASALLLALWFLALRLLGANWYLPLGAPMLATLLTLGAAVSYRQVVDARQLRRAEERYALAVQGANDGLWDWDLIRNTVYFSPRWKEIIGHQDEIGDSPDEWLSRVCLEDIGQLHADIQTHRAGHSPHLENEHRIRHRDGTERWALCRGIATRAKGNATRMAGSLSDITERKQNEEQLRFDALHDKLTKLPNRTLLMNLLDRAVEQKKRHPEHNFALLFLDLDHFKNINDSFGHLVGDDLLVLIAKRLKDCLSSDCTAARLSGD